MTNDPAALHADVVDLLDAISAIRRRVSDVQRRYANLSVGDLDVDDLGPSIPAAEVLSEAKLALTHIDDAFLSVVDSIYDAMRHTSRLKGKQAADELASLTEDMGLCDTDPVTSEDVARLISDGGDGDGVGTALAALGREFALTNADVEALEAAIADGRPIVWRYQLPKGERDDGEGGASYGPYLWVSDGDPLIYTTMEREFTAGQAREQALWWLAAADAADAADRIRRALMVEMVRLDQDGIEDDLHR